MNENPPIDAETMPFPSSKPLKNGQGRHLFKHGMSKQPEHKVWIKMMERCYSVNAINYERYGGRGIRVCEAWHEFVNFFRDMGPRPSKDHSIERKDNLCGYSPDNCIWATRVQQGGNKRNNVRVTYLGRTQSVAAWCRELGLDYHITRQRFYRDGWTAERAFQK